MIKWICRIWWTLQPSVNINVYYRAMEMDTLFSLNIFKVMMLKTAWEKLTKREQEFLYWKCQDIELYFRSVGVDKQTWDFLQANPVANKL